MLYNITFINEPRNKYMLIGISLEPPNGNIMYAMNTTK